MKPMIRDVLKAIVETVPVFGVLLIISVMIATFTGWVLNIIKLAQDVVTPNADFTIEILVRAVGIFATPFGAVMGYL